MTPRTMLVVLAFSSLLASAKVPHPGRELYTPTKQEWLLVEVGPCFLGAGGNSVANISAADDSETIRVELVSNVRADAREVDALYKQTQQTIEGAANRHGWLKWVKLERKDYPQAEDFKDRLTCPQSP
jgi:hypothetical protein